MAKCSPRRSTNNGKEIHLTPPLILSGGGTYVFHVTLWSFLTYILSPNSDIPLVLPAAAFTSSFSVPVPCSRRGRV
jgi:hypothetical protein